MRPPRRRGRCGLTGTIRVEEGERPSPSAILTQTHVHAGHMDRTTAREQQIIEALVGAYRDACFPMAEPESGEIAWYRPDPRAIIPLDRFHVPDNLRRRVASGRFEITTDTAFGDVMRGCSTPRPGSEQTWIDDNLLDWYSLLHRAGYAHSIEAWRGSGSSRRLVGGLYGVHIGGLFAGESMFSRPDIGGTDASKVCLVHLVRHMRRRGFALLDVQFRNPHLEQFGVLEIPHRRYQELIDAAVDLSVTWLPFDPQGARDDASRRSS